MICDLSDYNYTIKKAKCSCAVKESSSSFADIKIDKKKLLKNFKDIKSFINLNILVCYTTLLSKKSISHNIGFYNICFILLFRIVSIFIFYIKQSNKIKKQINRIIYAIKNLTNNLDNLIIINNF